MVGKEGSQANGRVQLEMEAQGWPSAPFAILLTFKCGLFFLHASFFCLHISKKATARAVQSSGPSVNAP